MDYFIDQGILYTLNNLIIGMFLCMVFINFIQVRHTRCLHFWTILLIYLQLDDLVGLVFSHFPHEWLPSLLYVYFPNVNCRGRTWGHNQCCAASHAQIHGGRPPGVPQAFPEGTTAPAWVGGSLCLPRGPMRALEERSLPCAQKKAPGENVVWHARL